LATCSQLYHRAERPDPEIPVLQRPPSLKGWGGAGISRAAKGGRELCVLAHAVAVAADVDDVAVVDEPVDEGAGHDLVAEDIAFEAEQLSF
jgi:hypothetical protein